MSKNLTSVDLLPFKISNYTAWYFPDSAENNPLFFDANIDAKSEGDMLLLSDLLGFEDILRLNQKHTDNLFCLSAEDFKQEKGNLTDEPADGLIVHSLSKSSDLNCAIGLMTADCMPVFFVSDDIIAMAHIGWKGLESSFAVKMMEEIRKLGPEPITVYIGPKAGADTYEFGPECLKKIPQSVSISSNDKCFLDMAATLKRQISEFSDVSIYNSNTCTITNTEFYSHRRDPMSKGRNLSLFSFGSF